MQDKFARVAALRLPRKREAVKLPAERERQAAKDFLTDWLGAEVGKNRYGEHLVVRRWFSSPKPFVAASPALRLLLRAGQSCSATHERLADPAEWLFLDTETTGLAGGTGTYAFLVGLAWWEDGGLQVEQFFMRDHDEEFSILLELSRRLAERRLLVTFNGKSFDWPLLETRFRMTRAIAPRPPSAHLDLLHPARHLWRLRLGSVRLKELEARVLDADGATRLDWNRRDDIDSALIPQIYFDYLRGGPVQPLADVFRHNQMDLRGLAALAGKIFSLLSLPEILERGQSDALELYGLSKLFRRCGETSRARLLSERALAAGLPLEVEPIARRELARLAKRVRDYARAISLWEELLRRTLGRRSEVSSTLRFSSLRRGRACPARVGRRVPGAASSAPTDAIFGSDDWASSGDPVDPRTVDTPAEVTWEAYEQLAIYYEHCARESQRAAQLTREALSDLDRALRAGRIEPSRYRKLQARFEHRLARLVRKTRGPLFQPASPATRRKAGESNEEP